MFTEIPPRMTEWLLFWKAPRIPMAWVQHMNSLKAQAEEVVMMELINS